MRVWTNIEPDTNSHRVVARLLFSNLVMNTKRIIRSGTEQADRDLDLITNGFAAEVRSELLKLIIDEKTPP